MGLPAHPGGGGVTVDPIASVVHFADVQMDLDALTLHRAGEPVQVEPQVFDVLRHLVEHRQRVVSKEELLDQVWGNRFVSESALTSRIGSARRAVGDDGTTQRVIRTVHGRGYQFVAELDRSPTTATAVPGTVPHQAPGLAPQQPLRTMVDRRELSATIAEHLRDCSVVTLVGPAGVGKSLLAQHVAARLADTYPAGVWLVSLAEARSDQDVGTRILRSVGHTRFPSTGSEETLISVLAGRPGLLILDNCEHLLDEVRRVVAHLVTGAGGLSVLATSRRRLDLADERVVGVPVLEREHGIALFRKRAAEQGLELPEESDAVVEEVCEALDQLPLALELACAQARVLGVRQLAGFLEHRLRLLASNAPDTHAHRTLKDAIAASVIELDEQQAETLARLSQLAGWFDLSAATCIAAFERDLDEIAAVQHVVALAERSLIQVDTAAPATRYRLLESIRLYAAAMLPDVSVAQRAHVCCFRDRAVQHGVRLAGPDFEKAFVALREDWTNVTVAVRYATEQAMYDEALDMLNATVEFAEVTLAMEHSDWSQPLLEAVAHRDDSRVREARAGRARMLGYERRLEEMARLVEEAGDPSDVYSVALSQFWLAGVRGDSARLADAFALLERLTTGSGGLRELTVGAVSHLAAHNSDVDPRAASARALRVSAESGDVGRAFGLVIAANLAHHEGRLDDVLAACAEAVELAEKLSLQVLVSQAHALRVMAVRTHDDLVLVARCVLEAMRHYRSRGHWTSARNDAPVAARVVAEAGLLAEAADVLDGYRPIGYRSVEPAYVSALRGLVAPAVGSGMEALLRNSPVDSERYCDLVIESVTRALARLEEAP